MPCVGAKWKRRIETLCALILAFKDLTGYLLCFNSKTNFTDSTVWNTGETGDIDNFVFEYINIFFSNFRTEGLFAALNDCLYRNMNDFRYLMLIDFDEFIIPHLNDSLPEMLQFLDQQKIVVGGRRVNPKKTSSYSFQVMS